MVEISPKDRAADAAYELATSPRDELAGARAELNDIWKAGNLSSADIGRSLEDHNLLAPLALYDSANLDTDNNGSYSYRELIEAANSTDSDELTKNLAEYLGTEVSLRGYTELTAAELRGMSDTPTDPIPGEMDFNPATVSDGEIGRSELAYANENFNILDDDNDDYVTSDEIDSYLGKNAGSITESDAAKLRDLSAQVGNLEEGSNDEFGDENDGFTRKDLEVAAGEMADELRDAPAETATEAATETPTAEEILSGEGDEEGESNEALATLSDVNSSTEDQLAAIKTLVAAGQTTATIRDADGTSLNIRLEVQPISEGSDRSYVHMFAVDENGREMVVLRAVTDGEGFAQQRDANGNFVSYVGRKWGEQHPDSVFGE